MDPYARVRSALLAADPAYDAARPRMADVLALSDYEKRLPPPEIDMGVVKTAWDASRARAQVHPFRGLLEGMYNSAKDAVTLPGRALYGEIGRPDEIAPQDAIGESLNFAAGAMPMTKFGMAPAADANFLSMKGTSLYNPPVKPAREFVADYPKMGGANVGERLKFDIDGRPITAPSERVVGRTVVGGADEALSPTQFDAIAEAATGRVPAIVPPSALRSRGSAGEVVVNRYSRKPELLQLSNTVPPDARLKVYQHELGHVIDQSAGEIPVDGLSREIKSLFNTLNTGRERTTNLMGPEHVGYKGDAIPREYMAEAIRAYMVDPNYIKTVAPKTAERIRKFVNGNPELSKIIQFNSVAAPLGAVGVGAGAFKPSEN